jgi:outer membrane protein assembly factor BamB
MSPKFFLVPFCFLTSVIWMVISAEADDWRQFRGAGGISVADSVVPTEFDDTKNLAWKVELPAKGASGPIVVDNKVIVTCSGGDNQDQLYTLCFDAESGQKLWTQKFWATGRCFVHPLSANAAPTPATDGKHVYAFYSSNDLACLDLDGNLIWYRALAMDYPKAGNDVGMASSPAVEDGVVVVQVDSQGEAFAMGLDAETGTTVWMQKRDKEAVWTSPLLLSSPDGPTMVVLQSKKGFDVLDLKTGKNVYSAEGMCSSISSSAVRNGKLYVPINGTTAYSISADGMFQELWNSSQIRPSSMSCVVYDGEVFALNGTGVLTSFSLADGSQGSKLRVAAPRATWATPVVSGGHMYFFTQNGKAHVVKLGEKPEVVHEHDFGNDEVFLGSPAISNNALYVRSDRFLYKIAESN